MHCPTLDELPPPPVGKTGWPWIDECNQLPSTITPDSVWPKVSIVTPSYNQGNFIEETIRSVLLQGYPNLEYIIIDGGSSDGSVEIIRKYEKWLRHWISEPDQGQSDAIAKGFKVADGEIIAWLNSDDYYHPKAVQKAVEVFQHMFVELIYGHCDILDRLGNFVERSHAPEFDYARLRVVDFIWQPATFIRRSAYNNVGGIDISLHWVMDWDLWLRIGQKK